MRHTFTAEQWLPYPVDVVFAFFSSPENLPRLMPTWQKARIEEATFVAPPPRPIGSSPAVRLFGIAAGEGTRITLSFRPFPFSPVRVPWDAKIDQFVWNDHFCDAQLRGPFAFWHHCHRVQSETRANERGIQTAGTVIHDEVQYEMRLGVLGEFANRMFMKRQMRSIFAYRQKRTAELIPRTLPRIGIAL